MHLFSAARTRQFAVLTALIASGFSSLWLPPAVRVNAEQTKTPDPWAASQTLQAAEFSSELADKKQNPPTIVYVGFRTLFAGGHIPGASFHGSASTEEGMAELKKWAETLSRSTDLVIYCGCCPFNKCPNIRPAFTAFEKMGFKKIRILALPNSFAKDWAEQGYPMQKGS